MPSPAGPTSPTSPVAAQLRDLAIVERVAAVLTTGSALPDGTETELTRLRPNTAYVLGGRAAQTNGIPREVQHRLGICWSGTRPSAGGQEVIASVPGATKQIAYTLDMGGRLEGADKILDVLIDNQVCTTFFPTSIMAVRSLLAAAVWLPQRNGAGLVGRRGLHQDDHVVPRHDRLGPENDRSPDHLTRHYPGPALGTIVLSHLGGYATPEALPVIVSTLRAQGYTFTTLSDMRDG